MINLSKAIHLGIIKAQKDYIEWSELGIGHSAEYLITTNIAQSIATLRKYIDDIKFIYVEQKMDELADWTELKASNFRNGRCDICIEGKDEQDYLIIEVKNTLTNKGRIYDSILQDIERIEVFLINSKTVSESYICFLNANFITDKKDTKENRNMISNKITERLNDFKKNLETKFKKLKFSFTTYNFIEKTSENKIWGWQSVVVRIKLK